MSTVLESVDFAEAHRALQLEIPGLDGYRADRLTTARVDAEADALLLMRR